MDTGTIDSAGSAKSTSAAISVPADAFERAAKRAAELSMTPAEFVAAALSHYLAYQDSLHLTHDIDEILTFDLRSDVAA